MQKKWLTDDRIASDERTPRFERCDRSLKRPNTPPMPMPLVRYVCLKQSVSLAWKNVRTGSVRMPTLRQMETLNMDRVAPILIRIYKEENTLEVWKQNRTGRFALLKSYPICKFSGKLGPKIIQAAI